MSVSLRLAGAPISWGVSEVPGWGHQMSAERVLREMASLGLTAIEAGPSGFLPTDPLKAGDLLQRHGLRVVAGFIAAVLDQPERRLKELGRIERRAQELAALGAEVLVIAAATSADGYDTRVEPDQTAWTVFFETLAEAERLARTHGLALAVHPHHGTLIDRHERVLQVLSNSEVGLCLDTGHLRLGGSPPAEIVRVAAQRIVHVHLKDVDRRLAREVAADGTGYLQAVHGGLYRPLGQGTVRIQQVIDRLKASRYGGWCVLEQDVALEADPPAGAGPIVSVRASLDFLAANA